MRLGPRRINPDPGVLACLGRVLYGIGCAVALPSVPFGIYRAGYSFELMRASHPTGASLTLATGILSIAAGFSIYGLGRLLRYLLSRE